MGVTELRRLKVLESENRKLKQLVTDLSLDRAMLQDILRYSMRENPQGETEKMVVDNT